MHSVTGFEQEQAPHIQQSELCATCHTLVTVARGPDGAIIGSLPEQMPYQEWRHSAFDAERRSCQSCHMPRVDGPVRVASVLGEERPSLARHTFLGGNAFMLRLMNRFRDELGIEATSAELEATARATVRQLEEDTATISIERAADGRRHAGARRGRAQSDRPQVSDRLSVPPRLDPRRRRRTARAASCSSRDG